MQKKCTEESVRATKEKKGGERREIKNKTLTSVCEGTMLDISSMYEYVARYWGIRQSLAYCSLSPWELNRNITHNDSSEAKQG